MLKRNLPFLQLAIVTLSLWSWAFAQQNLRSDASSGSNDEAALRKLVQNYFDLYAKKEIEAIVALFSPQSPIINTRRNIWQRLFPLENYEFSQPVISRIRIEGSRAFSRVSVERTATNLQNGAIRKTDVRAEYIFVKEGDEWKFWNETPAAIGLLGELTWAKTDAEREALFAEDPLLVTRDLLLQLTRNSDYAYTSADYSRAMNLLLAARIVAERLREKEELANVWQNIGIIHFVQMRNQQALEAYQRALSLNLELGRKPETARMLTSIGLVQAAMGKPTEALDSFNRGLKIHEELGEKAQVAQTLENIGNVHYDRGNHALASEFYQKCIVWFEASGAKNTVANRLLKVAKTEYEQGNDAAAIEFYSRAIARLEEAGELRSRGYAFHNIANIHYSLGDYAQALNYYLKSLKAEEESGNKQAQASALEGVGLVHSINGNYQLALDAYEKYLAVAQSLNDKSETASAFQKVGGSRYSLGLYAKALESFQSALALREQLNDSQDIATAMLDVGITYAVQNEATTALEWYEKSRKLFDSVNNFSGVATALLSTSVIYFAQQDFGKTLELADQAALAAKKGDDSDLFWQARHRAGRAHYRMKNLAAARQALNEAITTIETIRAQTNRNLQPRFYESRIAPYLAMVDVAIAEGKGNDAFNFAERAKARTLLGIVQSAKVWINKSMTARERERERQFLIELYSLPTQIFRESEKPEPNKFRIAELTEALKKVRSEYDAFLNRLYKLHPQLKVMRGQAKPLVVDQAVAMAPDSKSALLDYVETDEQVYLFVFTKSRKPAAKMRASKPDFPLRIYVLSTNRTDLLARVASVNQAISSRDFKSQGQLRDIYELLISPAAEQLKDKQNLIVVPDGAMWSLPFEALRTPENSYLIEMCTISRAPSLTALGAILKLRASAPVSRASNRTAGVPMLLAFSNPALNEQTMERIKAMLPIDRSGTTPGTEIQWQKETEALAGLYGAERSVIYTGLEANEGRLKSEAGKYRALHIASRAILNEAAPLFSVIAMASSDQSKEDGMLDLRELTGLDLRSEIIVLSSSEPALPQAGIGRSLTGASWTFFIAGCPTSLVGQWQVESPAVVDLMLEFHRGWKSSRQKTRSWQAAVKQILNREEYRHPYFWAGFSILGDFR